MAKATSIRGPSKSDMQEWEIENDLRTLQQAEEIEKDPKRMKAVKALAKKRLAGLNDILTEDESTEKKGK